MGNKHYLFSGRQFLAAWYQTKLRPPRIGVFKSVHLSLPQSFDTFLIAVKAPSLHWKSMKIIAMSLGFTLKKIQNTYPSSPDGLKATDYPAICWYLSLF